MQTDSRVERPFSLFNLVRAIEHAGRIESDEELDPDSLAEFRSWWADRRVEVAWHLEERQGLAKTLDDRVWFGLGVFMLDQDSSVGRETISASVSGYIVELNTDLGKFESDIHGAGYPDHASQVLRIQIQELWGMFERARELRTALHHAIHITHDDELVRKLTQYQGQLRVLAEESIAARISDLESLESGLANVCASLRNAYQSNSENDWDYIGKFLTNYEIPDTESSIPKKLNPHTTARWLRETYATLKERRERLRDISVKLVWYLQHDDIQSVRPDRLDDATGVQEQGREWVFKMWQDAWSLARAEPLSVRPLQSHALELLQELRRDAEPSGHVYYQHEVADEDSLQWTEQEFVSGTLEYLIRKIAEESDVGSGVSIEEHLQTALDVIDKTRFEIRPVLGHVERETGTRTAPYSAWGESLDRVTYQLMKGEYEAVRQTCDTHTVTHEADRSAGDTIMSRPNLGTLGHVTMWLEAFVQQSGSPPVGDVPFCRMLAVEGNAALLRLRRERILFEQLRSVSDKLDLLLSSRKANVTTALHTLGQASGRVRRMMGEDRRALEAVRIALLPCIELGPHESWVSSWRSVYLSDESIPSRQEWCEKWLPTALRSAAVSDVGELP